MQVLESLDLTLLPDPPRILRSLEHCCSTLLLSPPSQDPPGGPLPPASPQVAATQCAVLSVLGRHGASMPSAPYLLEGFLSALSSSCCLTEGGWGTVGQTGAGGLNSVGQTGGGAAMDTSTLIPLDAGVATENCTGSRTEGITGSKTDNGTDNRTDSRTESETEEEGLVLAHALRAALALFLARPAESQEVLGMALQLCWASPCVDTRDRALLYYHCLRTDPKLVYSLLSTDRPQTSL